jgi:hypothetical protein
MNQRIVQRCKDVVIPSLEPDEYVESVEVVQIGKVSARRQLAVSLIVGILTLGLVLVALRPRSYFLVLTNHRLLLLDNLRGSVGKRVVLAAPRDQVSAGPLRARLLTYRMQVNLDGTDRRFSWGRVQAASAQRVASALHAPAVA